MNTKPLLKPKGMYWRDLQQFEKTELLTQIPGLKTDSNFVNYRYYYSTNFKHWIITNAIAVPMTQLKTFSKVASNG
jgi:hypothetical protein